jgi:prophage regulatory protein
MASDLCLLRLPDVCRRSGIKRSQLYRLIAAGEFPPPVSLAGRSKAWRSDEVTAWIEARQHEWTPGLVRRRRSVESAQRPALGLESLQSPHSNLRNQNPHQSR